MKRNICLLPFAASLLLACTGTGAQTLDAQRAAMRVAMAVMVVVRMAMQRRIA